jgi:hypothetical protein
VVAARRERLFGGMSGAANQVMRLVRFDQKMRWMVSHIGHSRASTLHARLEYRKIMHQLCQCVPMPTKYLK